MDKKGGALRRPSSLSSTLHVPRGAARGQHEDTPEIFLATQNASKQQMNALLEEEINYRKKVSRTRRDRNEELERRLRHYSKVSLSRTKSKSRRRLDQPGSEDESHFSSDHCCCDHRSCKCQDGHRKKASKGYAKKMPLSRKSRAQSQGCRSHSRQDRGQRGASSCIRNRSRSQHFRRESEPTSSSTEETIHKNITARSERSKSRPKKKSPKPAEKPAEQPVIQMPLHCGDMTFHHAQPIIRTVAGGDRYQPGQQPQRQNRRTDPQSGTPSHSSRPNQTLDDDDRQQEQSTPQRTGTNITAFKSNGAEDVRVPAQQRQSPPKVAEGNLMSSSQTQEEIDLVKTALLQHISKMVKHRPGHGQNYPPMHEKDEVSTHTDHSSMQQNPASRENTSLTTSGRDPRILSMHATLDQQPDTVRVRTGREGNQQQPNAPGSSGRKMPHGPYGGSGRQQRPAASGHHQRNPHQGQQAKPVKYRTTLPPSSFSGGLPISSLGGRSNVTKGNMPNAQLSNQGEQMKVSNVVVGSQQVVSSLAATQQDLIAAASIQPSRKARSSNDFQQAPSKSGLNTAELAKPAVSGKSFVSQGNNKLSYYEEDGQKEPAGPHMLKPKASEMPSPFYKQRAAGPVYAPNFFPDIEQIIAERIKIVATPSVDPKEGKKVMKTRPFQLYDQPPPPENRNPLAHLAPTDDTGLHCYNDGGAPVGGAHAMVRQPPNYHRSSRTRRPPTRSESQSGSYVRKSSGKSQPMCCDLRSSSEDEDFQENDDPRTMTLSATPEAPYDGYSSRGSDRAHFDAGADERRSTCSQGSTSQKSYVGDISEVSDGRFQADSSSSSSWSLHEGEKRRTGGSSGSNWDGVNLKAYQREIAALVKKKHKSPVPVDESYERSDDGRLTSGESAYAESSRGRSGGKDPSTDLLITKMSPKTETSEESSPRRMASSVAERKHSVRFSFIEKPEDSEVEPSVKPSRPRKHSNCKHVEEPSGSLTQSLQTSPKRTFTQPAKSATSGGKGDGGSPTSSEVHDDDKTEVESYDREKEALKTAYQQKFYQRLAAIMKADVENDLASEMSPKTAPVENNGRTSSEQRDKPRGILKVRSTEQRKPQAYSSEETGATTFTASPRDDFDELAIVLDEEPEYPPDPLEEVGSSRAHAGESEEQTSATSTEEEPCCPTINANLCPKPKPRRKDHFSTYCNVPRSKRIPIEKEVSEESEEETPLPVDPFCPPEKGLQHMIPKMPPEMLDEIALAIERRKKEIEAEQASGFCRTMPAMKEPPQPDPCAKPKKKCKKKKKDICQQFSVEEEEEEPECTSAVIRDRIAREMKARKKAAYGC